MGYPMWWYSRCSRQKGQRCAGSSYTYGETTANTAAMETGTAIAAATPSSNAPRPVSRTARAAPIATATTADATTSVGTTGAAARPAPTPLPLRPNGRIALLAALGAVVPSRGQGEPSSCSGTLHLFRERGLRPRPGSLLRDLADRPDRRGCAPSPPRHSRSPGRRPCRLTGSRPWGPARAPSRPAGRSSAHRSTGNGGEVELRLDTVERERSAMAGYTVSGTLHARLLSAGKQADVVTLDVRF